MVRAGRLEAVYPSVGDCSRARGGEMETAAWAVLVLCLLSAGECLDTDLLLFLRDVLRGTVVVASCWPTRQSMELVKALSQSEIMTSMQDCSGHISVPVPCQPATFLLDLQSKNAARLTRQADEMDLFSSPNRWLMIMAPDVITTSNGTEPEVPDTSSPADYGPLKELLSLLSSMKVFVDSQVTVARRLEDGSFSLMEVYRMGPGQRAVVRTTGLWQRQSGLRTTELSLPARRTNLHKTRLKTAMVVTTNDTLDHLTDLHNKHIDTITKLNYILLLHVIDIMNASIEFTVVDTWGYPTNGSWSGMVGYLQRKEADIGATALFFTANRLPVIDYIAMTTPTRSKFVFRQPPLSFVTNVFTLPFSQGVWLSSAGLVGVCTVVLYCALSREAGQSPSRTGVAWSDVMLLSLGAVCQQGSQIQSSEPSGRIVTLFMFVAVLFLYTSYSGCIVALLQSSTDSIRTLEDLLNSRLEVGAHDIVYNRYYFETATDPVRKGLYGKVLSSGSKTPNFLELEEGVEKVRRGFFAFHMEESSGYKVVLETYTEEEKCGMHGIGGYIQVPDPWVAVQKNTPYKELMKRGYHRVQEHGLQSRELSRLYTRKPECSGHSSSFVSVGLVDLYPALLVILAGTIISLLSLLLEMVVHKKCCASSVSLLEPPRRLSALPARSHSGRSTTEVID